MTRECHKSQVARRRAMAKKCQWGPVKPAAGNGDSTEAGSCRVARQMIRPGEPAGPAYRPAGKKAAAGLYYMGEAVATGNGWKRAG
jgi:hypothetical protein